MNGRSMGNAAMIRSSEENQPRSLCSLLLSSCLLTMATFLNRWAWASEMMLICRATRAQLARSRLTKLMSLIDCVRCV